MPAQQRSFEDLGVALCDVTFCVIDLETTGAAASSCAITEVGAVKVRGGECLGTFSTLVNPGVGIPPFVSVLTGITDVLVAPAPRVGAVLPSLLEFVGDSVVVGHNVRFDLSFLGAALAAHGYPALPNRWVDTCALARRLVREEVPNCTLGVLAERLRLAHRPAHRALADALATADLLHALLERAAGLGVLGLDDLLELPTVKGHPQVAKLRLTADLPRRPGVYLFRDAGGRVLYVGKARNLRQRVRGYFTGDERRKVGQLLREVAAVDHVVCATDLEAAVLEVRLVHEHVPRFNRQLKRWRRYAYLKLTLDERFPRLSVVRAPKRDDGCLYLGPLGSTAAARLVAEAIEAVVPLRRCTRRPPRTPLPAPCAPAQLGVATCPCSGQVSQAEYDVHVRRVVDALTRDPASLLQPLERRMHDLAGDERFEEAAAARDRAAALTRALRRQRRLDGLRRAGRLVVEISGEARAVIARGRLVRVDDGPLLGAAPPGWPDDPGQDDSDSTGPVPRELADELACVAGWLDAEAARVRLLACDGVLASPLPALPRYEPGRPATTVAAWSTRSSSSRPSRTPSPTSPSS